LKCGTPAGRRGSIRNPGAAWPGWQPSAAGSTISAQLSVGVSRPTAIPLSGPQYLDDLGVLSEVLVSTCAIVRAENGRGGWCAAETLRVKGERLLEEGGSSSATQAEAVFRTALRTAREQEALSFELRTAMSLARLLRSQYRSREAQDLLVHVYTRFTEGFATADLLAAKSLLNDLADD